MPNVVPRLTLRLPDPHLMPFDPMRHHRRSIRLPGYDYGRAGAYFITICTENRAYLFGDVVGGQMRANDAGRMVHDVWEALPAHYPGVVTDAWIVMPNHVNGVVVLVGAAPRGRPIAPRGRPMADDDAEPPDAAEPRGRRDGDVVVGMSDSGHARGRAGHVPGTHGGGSGTHGGGSGTHGGGSGTHGGGSGTHGGVPLRLPDVVHRLKSMTTHRYADGVKRWGWPPFPGRLWQRNYYEHIIRDDGALDRIRAYIADNPARWPLDRQNPTRTRSEPDAGRQDPRR